MKTKLLLGITTHCAINGIFLHHLHVSARLDNLLTFSNVKRLKFCQCMINVYVMYMNVILCKTIVQLTGWYNYLLLIKKIFSLRDIFCMIYVCVTYQIQSQGSVRCGSFLFGVLQSPPCKNSDNCHALSRRINHIELWHCLLTVPNTIAWNLCNKFSLFVRFFVLFCC